MIVCNEANLHAALTAARPAIRRLHLHATGAHCGRDEYGVYWQAMTRQGVTLSLVVNRTRGGKVAARVVGAVA